MYKILIKYESNSRNILNLWEVYGTVTTTSTGETSFKEFETDDIEVLKEELLKLDKEKGNSQIKVVDDKTISFSVNVNEDSSTETEN